MRKDEVTRRWQVPHRGLGLASRVAQWPSCRCPWATTCLLGSPDQPLLPPRSWSRPWCSCQPALKMKMCQTSGKHRIHPPMCLHTSWSEEVKRHHSWLPPLQKTWASLLQAWSEPTQWLMPASPSWLDEGSLRSVQRTQHWVCQTLGSSWVAPSTCQLNPRLSPWSW